MSDTVNKYLNTQIYKIVDNSYTEQYIGSTYDTLSSRMTKHRCDYRRYKKGEYHYVSVFDLFDKYDVGNCKIELVEHYPCETKEEQRTREGYHIRKENCINKRVAGRDNKQYYREHIDSAKEYNKKYYIDNFDIIKKKKKQYNDTHKEEIHIWAKQYRENNLSSIKEKYKEYYAEHKDTILARNKQYNIDHAEELSENKKKYCMENLETIREYKKNWREENRERLIKKK